MSDRDGRCLYIGCTTDLRRRLMAHKGNKPWFGDVWQLEVETFPSQAEALAAEAVAIAAAEPIYNYQHTPKANAPRPYLIGKRAWPSNRYRVCSLFLERLHGVDLEDRILRAGGDFQTLATELAALDEAVAVTPVTLRKWAEEIVVAARRAS